MSLFRRMLGLDSENACDEGLAALGRRDFAAAAGAFHVCIDSSRRESTMRLARFHLAECHTQLALAAWDRGDVEEARQEIEAALSHAQPTAERHLIAAQMARRAGDRQDVVRHTEAALSRVPDHEPALALSALHFYEEGLMKEAMARASTLPVLDSRLRRFHEAHERGDRHAAASHLAAVAAGYPDSLL